MKYNASMSTDLFNNYGSREHCYPRVGVSSEGIAVVLCVCVPSFSVQAAATFSPHTRETPDLLA